MIIELPRYQRTISAPQVSPVAPSVAGDMAVGNAQSRLVNTLLGDVGQVAGAITQDYLQRVSDQAATWETFYNSGMADIARRIEENPNRVALNGDDEADPYGTGYSYANEEFLMQERERLAEDASKYLSLPGAKRYAEERAGAIDEIFRQGIRRYDQAKNAEVRVQRYFEHLETAVQYENIGMAVSNTALALAAGTVDHATANDALMATSEQIARRETIAQFRELAQEEGFEAAMAILQNPNEDPEGRFWFEQTRIDGDGEVSTVLTMHDPSIFAELSDVLISDNQAALKQAEETHKRVDGAAKSDGYNRIWGGEITTQAQLADYMDRVDNQLRGQTGLGMTYETRKALTSALEQQLGGGDINTDYWDNQARSIPYYVQGDAYLERLRQFEGKADPKVLESLMAKVDNRLQYSTTIVRSGIERVVARQEREVERLRDKGKNEEADALEAWNAKNLANLYRQIEVMGETYPNEVEFEEQFTKLMNSDFSGQSASEVATKVDNADLRESFLSGRDYRKTLAEVDNVGMGTSDAGAVAWGLARTQMKAALEMNYPGGMTVLDAGTISPSVGNNLPAWKVVSVDQFGDDQPRWVSHFWDEAEGKYKLRVKDPSTPGSWREEDIRISPPARVTPEQRRAYEFPKDAEGNFAPIDYNEIPVWLKTYVDNAIGESKAFTKGSYLHWNATRDGGNITLPPLSAIMNVPLEMLPEPERLRRTQEMNARKARLHGGYRY